MYSLNEQEISFLKAMCILHKKGISLVSVELPEYSKMLFPHGYSVQKFNTIVPNLVSEGFIISNFESPRDGPILRLTEKTLERFGNG
jgi:hypothetical protein